jgi:hypothetical protein
MQLLFKSRQAPKDMRISIKPIAMQLPIRFLDFKALGCPYETLELQSGL